MLLPCEYVEYVQLHAEFLHNKAMNFKFVSDCNSLLFQLWSILYTVPYHIEKVHVIYEINLPVGKHQESSCGVYFRDTKTNGSPVQMRSLYFHRWVQVCHQVVSTAKNITSENNQMCDNLVISFQEKNIIYLENISNWIRRDFGLSWFRRSRILGWSKIPLSVGLSMKSSPGQQWLGIQIYLKEKWPLISITVI